MLFFNTSCQNKEETTGGYIENRDSIPILKSIGVSTLISDSGVVRYKIISEDWFVYDKKDPPYWSFEKGLFIEKFDEEYHVAVIGNDSGSCRVKSFHREGSAAAISNWNCRNRDHTLSLFR